MAQHDSQSLSRWLSLPAMSITVRCPPKRHWTAADRRALISALSFALVGTSRYLQWQKRSIFTKAQVEPTIRHFCSSVGSLWAPRACSWLRKALQKCEEDGEGLSSLVAGPRSYSNCTYCGLRTLEKLWQVLSFSYN
jgi:hypothetical protein